MDLIKGSTSLRVGFTEFSLPCPRSYVEGGRVGWPDQSDSWNGRAQTLEASVSQPLRVDSTVGKLVNCQSLEPGAFGRMNSKFDMEVAEAEIEIVVPPKQMCLRITRAASLAPLSVWFSHLYYGSRNWNFNKHPYSVFQHQSSYSALTTWS